MTKESIEVGGYLYQAMCCGIDWGDEPLENVAKYCCENTGVDYSKVNIEDVKRHIDNLRKLEEYA